MGSFRVALDCGDVLDDLSIVQWGLYVTRYANVITRDRLFRRNNKGFVHLDHQEIILGPKMLEYKYLCRNKPGRPIQDTNVSKHVDCGQNRCCEGEQLNRFNCVSSYNFEYE